VVVVAAVAREQQLVGLELEEVLKLVVALVDVVEEEGEEPE